MGACSVRRAAWALLLVLGAVLPCAASADAPVLDLTGMTYVASEGSANEVVLRAGHAQMQSDSEHVRLQRRGRQTFGGGNRQGYNG